MTAYSYDLWGWYAGPVLDGEKRSTPIAPSNVSQTTEVGELRANWSGFAWVERAYEPPTPETLAVPEQVLRWQAVRALRLHEDPVTPGQSCLDTVNALCDAIADANMRADVQDALQSVMSWRRTSPTLMMMATAAGWSSEFVDRLLIAADGYDL